MRFTYIRIKNFKSIRNLEIDNIENALLIVGKNNTGKTSVLDAVRVITGMRPVEAEDFNEVKQNIEIEAVLEITKEDQKSLHEAGLVSPYKRMEVWEREFYKRLPSVKDGLLRFVFIANQNGTARYYDGVKKDNPYIRELLPKLHYIDAGRGLKDFQNDLLLWGDNRLMKQMQNNSCLFPPARRCTHCFNCMGLIYQKLPETLNVMEAEKLFEYKLFQLNLGGLVSRINENFRKNGGYEDILYQLQCNVEQMFQMKVETAGREGGSPTPIEHMSKGMRSIYMLSLLETYVEDDNRIPSIIVVEYPELFLHPQLQKVAGEILYRLSKKNQVIFSTHSPQLLLNFTERQIRQIVLDAQAAPVVRPRADIGGILTDLGYSAGDILNVDFVFIVEGKQDKSRLPLLLEKYYETVQDENGELSRISIISTNSCTNIKTYANLKYMNQIYLKDQFLMIRDGDGKDPEELAEALCSYYENQNEVDADKLPRVRRENVLILKYYSFENYFLNPAVMTKLGVVTTEEDFYEILWGKWNEYLYGLKSGRRLTQEVGRSFTSKEDLKAHMEAFKIHMRGHNIYDIFYGRYKKNEKELLKKYIETAPKEDFSDILTAIDKFLYFDSRKKMPE